MQEYVPIFRQFYTFITGNGLLASEPATLLLTQLVVRKALSDTVVEHKSCFEGAHALPAEHFLCNAAEAPLLPSFTHLLASLSEQSVAAATGAFDAAWVPALLPHWRPLLSPIPTELEDAYLQPVMQSLTTLRLPITPAGESSTTARFMKEWMRHMGELRRDSVPTPHHLAALMAELLAPAAADAVFDPCAGCATLLTQAAEHAGSSATLYAQEVNRHNYLIGCANLLMHGFSAARFTCADSIIAPAFAEEGRLQQFDKVMSIPPFGVKFPAEWAAAATVFGIPHGNRSASVFLNHCLARCKTTTGKLVICMPRSFLNACGREKEQCKYLLEANLISAIIQLPRGATGIGNLLAALLVIDFARAQEPHRGILMVNATPLCPAANRGICTIPDAARREIVSCCNSRAEQPGFSSVITRERILENEVKLLPEFYLSDPAAVDPECEDPAALASRIAELERTLSEKQALLDSLLKDFCCS